MGWIVIQVSDLKNLKIEEFSGKLLIRNNSLLTDVRMLWKFFYFQSSSDECEMRIENNVKLDASLLCDYGFMWTIFGIRVNGNWRDCGRSEISENEITVAWVL